MQVKMKLFPLRIYFLNSQSPVAEVQNSTTTSKEPFEKKITKALKSEKDSMDPHHHNQKSTKKDQN